MCAAALLDSLKMNSGASGVGQGISITFLIVDIRLSGHLFADERRGAGEPVVRLLGGLH